MPERLIALEPLGLVSAELLGALLAGYLVHLLAWRLLRRFARSTSTIVDDSLASHQPVDFGARPAGFQVGDEGFRPRRRHLARSCGRGQQRALDGERTLLLSLNPEAVAGVRGTTLWGDIDVDAICALEGTIEVRSLKSKRKKTKAKKLAAGQCAAQLSKGKTKLLEPTPGQVREYLSEVLIQE